MASKVLLGKRRGSVIIYVALALVVLLGAAGLAIDVGHLYLERDKAQRAADAAALAGAIQLRDEESLDDANAAAKAVAAKNGYDYTKGATVICTVNPGGVNPYWYQVYVAKPAPVFFMAIFGWRFKTIGAPATAIFNVPVELNINGGGTYGVNGPVTLSMFGPYAQHTYGDCYSPIYLQNNKPNPLYSSTGQYGYNFNITIPKNYADLNGTNKIYLQIFDPDTYNGNGSADAVQGASVDEIRYPQNGNPKVSTVDDTANYDKANTTTRYTLYDTKGTADKSDDTVIATVNYQDDSDTDMAWVTPDGFKLDITDPRWASRFTAGGDDPVNFRLNVKTVNGASENGFNLRAGKPIDNVRERLNKGKTQYSKYNSTTGKWGNWSNTNPFNSNNGTNITASGSIPMNFNAYGTTTIALGHVEAGATSVSITKFDTDVGATSVYYSDGIRSYTGVLSGGDEFKTDKFNLGDDYAGGDWTATYAAGTGDTSVWDMSFVGPSSLSPGSVRLVK